MPAQAQQTEREREQQFTYYWYAARQAKENGQYDRALMLLLQCEQLNPDDALTKETIGLLYYGTGRRRQAQEYIAKAFNLDPGERWQTYYNLLDLLPPNDDQGKAEQQLNVLERAAEANPKNPEIYENMVSLYSGFKNWKRAFECLDKIEELRGKDPRCALVRYRLYRYLNKDKKALKAVEDYLKVDPANPELLKLQIVLLSEHKASVKKLRPLYDRLLTLTPNDPSVLNNYAWMLAENKTDLNFAETLVLRALNADSENPIFIDTYAWILYQKGKRDMARYFIRQAMQLTSPSSPAMKEIQKHYKIIYK